MKYFNTLLLVILAHFISYGQCSTLSVQISSSDTTRVQLYNAGIFNIPSGFANVCVWEVTTFSGEIVHQDTTSGGSTAEQSFSLFDHMVPITDSMRTTIVITNEMEGITCTMSDTLFWEVTEVLPGSFIGNWGVLSSNSGVEEDISTITENTTFQDLNIYPSPTAEYFSIDGTSKGYSFSIFDLKGQLISDFKSVDSFQKIDVSQYSNGVYFIHFWNEERSEMLGIQKLIKI